MDAISLRCKIVQTKYVVGYLKIAGATIQCYSLINTEQLLFYCEPCDTVKKIQGIYLNFKLYFI